MRKGTNRSKQVVTTKPSSKFHWNFELALVLTTSFGGHKHTLNGTKFTSILRWRGQRGRVQRGRVQKGRGQRGRVQTGRVQRGGMQRGKC